MHSAGFVSQRTKLDLELVRHVQDEQELVTVLVVTVPIREPSVGIATAAARIRACRLVLAELATRIGNTSGVLGS